MKRQGLLTAEGKVVLPTRAGLQLFEVLRGAAPALVDPGTTALWEMRLDEIVTGKAEFRTVIDGVAEAANGLIEALQKQSSQKVDLQKGTKARDGARRYRRSKRTSNAKGGRTTPSLRRSKASHIAIEKVNTPVRDNQSSETQGRREPTSKMIAYAQMLARSRKAGLPEGYQRDFDTCRRFLDEHAK